MLGLKGNRGARTIPTPPKPRTGCLRVWVVWTALVLPLRVVPTLRVVQLLGQPDFLLSGLSGAGTGTPLQVIVPVIKL